MRKWKILARHKCIVGATVTESVDVSQETSISTIRRFTATIRGYRGLVIYEGDPKLIDLNQVFGIVQKIRDCIDTGDLAVINRNFHAA
ncbi:hypothetical protein ACFVS2_20895 [Brevibacillus sp. NPDC058079]|uniref:hypothetical protein n=1 Tax=Brevibacillus sp. NPDC058079 TaxID=3346330 RepID=UPI0036E67E46